MILNPDSGRGLPLKKLPEIEALLKSRKIQYQLRFAHAPEDATHLAAQACRENAEAVIAIGGDGTLFQIVNGMVGGNVPLLIAPCGTGNDFIRSLNLPREPVEALRLQLDTPIKHIDVGRMNDTFFLNVAGTGFDVDVLRYAERHKKKYAGLRPYMMGLVEALRMYKPMRARISVDGQPEEYASFAIISIGNGRYIGGGMKAVPDALVNDGLFDVVMVKPVRRFVILPLIAFYIAGKHARLGLATVQRCREITIYREGMTLNLDGELRNADVARFQLYPSALPVRIPGI